MKWLFAWVFLALGTATPWLACAADWPTHATLGNGIEVGVKGIFQYDWASFDDDRLPDGQHRFDDDQAWRRQEVEVYLQRHDAFEVTAGYDFAYDEWVDNYLAFHTAAGKFKLGEFRTLVGWESGTISGAATTFIEAALPVLVVYEGRRAGVGWHYSDIDHWTFQAQWFLPHDLNHEGDGTTVAARVVYTPIKRDDALIHLGLSASRETRDGHHAQFETRPEARLTPVRLIGTDTLDNVQYIRRRGLEAAWMRGPMLVQGEYLDLRAQRDVVPDFHSHGGYVSLSWMLTGESLSYKTTALGNPAPRHAWGAVSIGVRYSRVDLDDEPVRGGREHDWTVGINWYINKHFKLQANDICAVADHGDLLVNPHIYEVRAQVTF